MLPQHERLKINGLFQQAYQKGKTASSRNFKIRFTSSLPHLADRMPLVGFVVSKNFSKHAVIRNHIKRKIREVYRLYRLKENKSNKLKKLGLVVISIKTGFDLVSYQEIKNELENLLEKILYTA
jgi:ribonuclease P protein component